MRNQQPLHRIKPRIMKHARTMRHPITPPEAKLWSRLRNRQLGGFEFRRQHPIGSYIADFFCAETKLVIELDGDSHADQEEYEKRRTEWLIQQGLKEIRFWNRDVFQNLENVLETILNACSQVQPSLPPSP